MKLLILSAVMMFGFSVSAVGADYGISPLQKVPQASPAQKFGAPVQKSAVQSRRGVLSGLGFGSSDRRQQRQERRAARRI